MATKVEVEHHQETPRTSRPRVGVAIMGFPWRENEKLIKALYQRLQNVESDLAVLRREYDKVLLITELKNQITNKIIEDLKPALSKELTESIAESLSKRIIGLKQGVV